jgi:predicted nucleotidyltransferase component of viral defense system
MKDNMLKILKTQLAQVLRCNLLPQNSYLAGGTAVYLYLKHRISIDIDFFTSTNFISENFFYLMKQCVKNIDLELMEKDTIILYISKEKIKFSLFFLPYPLLAELQPFTIENNTCMLASQNDIEAMKAVAICQRGSAKDFVDLYFLLKNTNHNFNDILKMVIKKYDVNEDYEYHLKTSFIYFDDAEKEINNIIMLKNDNQIEKITKQEWENIKNFFLGFIK